MSALQRQPVRCRCRGGVATPWTLFGFKQHVEGDAGKRFRGAIGPDDRPVEVDLVNQTIRSTKPVTSHGDGRYTFEGSPGQVRESLIQAAPKLGLSVEQIEDLIARAPQIDAGDGMVRGTLKYDLTAATRLAAKCALGALVVARGEDAADSKLASSLRSIALGEVDQPLLDGYADPLEVVKGASASVGRPIGTDGSVAVLINGGEEKTLGFIELAGVLLPPLILSGVLPEADLIATVVEDAPGGAVVWGVAEAIAASHEAEQPANRGTAEDAPER